MRSRWLYLLFSLFTVALSATGQTAAQSPTELQQQVNELQQLVRQLQERVDELTKSRPANASEQNAVATQEQVEAVDQKLRILERNRELEQENAQEKAKQASVLSAGADGFSISSADKSYRLRFGGLLQVDGKSFYDDHQTFPNNFVVRRLRPILEGTVGKYIDYRFVPDFGNGSTALYDAYADLKYLPYAVLRGGKFKTPLGLEQLQSDSDSTFIERSLATGLVPNRDVGFQLYGSVPGGVTYTAAVLNGAPVGQNIDSSTHSGKDVVGRVFATPWATGGPEVLKGLGFGAAASSGRQDQGAALPSFKSTGAQATFFSYLSTSAAAGRRLNYTPQLYYYNGPFGLLAEYTVSQQRVSGPGATKGTTVSRNIAAHAWQVSGSWVLTGEKKSYGKLTPRKGLDGKNNGRGYGAWEIATRYSALNVDPAVYALKFADPLKAAQTAREWAVGLNWYLNRNVRLASNFEQTHFLKGAAAGNRATEKAFEQRLQIAF